MITTRQKLTFTHICDSCGYTWDDERSTTDECPFCPSLSRSMERRLIIQRESDSMPLEEKK